MITKQEHFQEYSSLIQKEVRVWCDVYNSICDDFRVVDGGYSFLFALALRCEKFDKAEIAVRNMLRKSKVKYHWELETVDHVKDKTADNGYLGFESGGRIKRHLYRVTIYCDLNDKKKVVLKYKFISR